MSKSSAAKKAEVEEKRSDAHRTIRGWASKHLAIV
jgi:hypothetical protein